jgi:hypothetical protein
MAVMFAEFVAVVVRVVVLVQWYTVGILGSYVFLTYFLCFSVVVPAASCREVSQGEW